MDTESNRQSVDFDPSKLDTANFTNKLEQDVQNLNDLAQAVSRQGTASVQINKEEWVKEYKAMF